MSARTTRSLLLGTALSGSTLAVLPAFAQDFGTTGFSISFGNEVIAGAPPPVSQSATRADIALQRAEVDVKFDSLTNQRLLTIETGDQRGSYAVGERVPFRASTNYPAFVQRAEVLIYDKSVFGKRIIDRVAIAPNGTADWTMPPGGLDRFAFALRVYDAEGRYDQTQIKPLLRASNPKAAAMMAPVTSAGEGADSAVRRAIPVNGGTVTVAGRNGPAGGEVLIMGEPVPVDGQGRFVVTRILPAGDRVVDVRVNGETIRRDVQIPRSDWFGVGLIDVTAGLQRRDGRGDERSLDGRLAYYIDGKTASGLRVTSSADTQYGPLKDAFERLNRKDPQSVLNRLRADSRDIYPTYGDDSQAYDDTPTSGNVYVRIETDTTRFLWGDFNAGLTQNPLLGNTRSLYGAELRYNSLAVTNKGETRSSATIYAAQPSTRSRRDVLRGTGGSLFFLSRQDIVSGSAKLTVQVIDPDTGVVIETRALQAGSDFTIDHLQGVVQLSAPLSSGIDDGRLIGGAGDTYDINLVAQYEYTPTNIAVDDSVMGGAVQAWVTDDLRVGVTAMREDTDAGQQDMIGASLLYQMGEASSVSLNWAQTDGPGLQRSTSTDGGLTLNASGGAAGTGQAIQVRGAFEFADLGIETPGQLSFIYDRKEAGFSTLNSTIDTDQELIGFGISTELTQSLSFDGSVETFKKDGGEDRREAELALTYQINPQVSVEAGLAFLDQSTPGDATKTGERLDAAVRLGYALSDSSRIYGFVQGTLDKSGGLADNTRAGVGGQAAVTDQLTLTGEVSDGDGGMALDTRLSYQATADNELYIGYSLDPTRNPGLDDRGRFVLGGAYRHNESLATYAETVYDRPGNQRSLTEAYGVTYTPVKEWTLSGGLEKGTIRDSADGDFDRTAVSFGAAYAPSEDLNMRARLEYRVEDGDGTARDRDTYAITAGYSNQIAKDWRMLIDADALLSDSAEGDFRDGEYIRASLGYAYRPIDNERLNVLFRYTYLDDLPGEDQVNAAGEDEGPQQRSNVLSVAASYDLDERFTLGGKLGYRSSEIAARGSDDFSANTATLAALRLDWHLPHEWDVLAEGRVLYTQETDTTETGALFGVYRHIGEHAKIGLAYEWGSVSDDATDIDYEGQGLFLNVIGKF